MQIPLKNSSGKVVREIAVSDGLFGLPLTSNLRGLIHQAVTRQRANARSGTASTKTRAQVIGSTRKLFPQKGTGRARVGSVKSPLRRGGGRAFGPHPRSYRQRMPKKMRRQAIRGALSAKASGGRLLLMEGIDLGNARTKSMVGMLEALNVHSSALVVLHQPERSVSLAVRNIPRVKVLQVELLNVLDLVRYDAVVMTVDAAKRTEALWGESKPAEEAASAA
ncbi:MAG: 50S ribosomal protein L4 [Chloroflexi bacterium]|nr:50S ribosomal protein L4 [Chloroflexota bacterium]